MKKHVAVLAAFHFIFGVLALLLGAGVLLFGFGGGMLTAVFGGDGSFGAGGLIAMLGAWVGGFIALFGGLDLLTAVGLISKRWYGWVLGIVSSLFYVFSFSWWTILGIYGLWVLCSAGGRKVFSEPS